MICDRTLKVLHTCSYCCYHSYTHCNWSRRACVRHPWWRTKRSWPLFSPTFFFFGPGGLRAPPVVADEAKLAIVFTYFFLCFLVQTCLRAPHVVADEAKLAIVFIYFFFGPGVLACTTRGEERSEAGHCFHLLFFLLLFPPTLSALYPLRGNSRA